MSILPDHPTRTPELTAQILALLDQGAEKAGLPSYSLLAAANALHVAAFDKAVHERAVGLVRAENRRLRIALTIALQDVLAVQALLAKGQRSEAELAIFAMLPELRAAAHKLKPTAMPAGVASLEAARERRDGAR